MKGRGDGAPSGWALSYGPGPTAILKNRRTGETITSEGHATRASARAAVLAKFKAKPVAYELMARRCGECLVTKERIVPGSRAAELVAKCRADDVKFLCHKSTMAGGAVACRGVHDLTGGCRAFRFASAVGIPIHLFNPETLEREPDDETATERPRGTIRRSDR